MRIQKRALVQENIRRWQGWTVKVGNRRLVAEALVREAETYLPGRSLEPFTGWAFVWEITGSYRKLRQMVERLTPYWQENGKRVIDPDEARLEDCLTNPGGQERANDPRN